MDITPFLLYFIENVYDKIGNDKKPAETLEKYKEALKTGKLRRRNQNCGLLCCPFMQTSRLQRNSWKEILETRPMRL